MAHSKTFAERLLSNVAEGLEALRSNSSALTIREARVNRNKAAIRGSDLSCQKSAKSEGTKTAAKAGRKFSSNGWTRASSSKATGADFTSKFSKKQK